MQLKNIKKYLLFIILGIVSFSFGIENSSAQEYVNYNGIHMNVKEYNTLLNLGFTDEQIYHMDKKTYLSNKDLDAKLISQTTRYYKTISSAYGKSYDIEVTKEEYNNSKDNNQIRGIVNTTYKRIISSIAQNGNKYRYTVTTSWKQMPSVHSYDIIGIGFDDDVYISSSVYFSYTYANSNAVYTTSTTYYNKKSTSTGGAAVYKIPDNIVSLSATLYYDVSKDTSSTITLLSICGDYAHATSNVPVSNVSDYGISIYGISLGSTLGGYYDATPCAMEYANVNW